MEFYHGMTLGLLLPNDETQPGTASTNVSIHRLNPADARDSLALNRALHSWDRAVRVSLDDRPLLIGTLSSSGVFPREMAIVEQFADDFDALLTHTRSRRLLPDPIPSLDRATAL